DVAERSPSDGPRAVARASAYTKIAAERDFHFTKRRPQPDGSAAQGLKDLLIREAGGRFRATGNVAAECLLQCIEGQRSRRLSTALAIPSQDELRDVLDVAGFIGARRMLPGVLEPRLPELGMPDLRAEGDVKRLLHVDLVGTA